MPTCYLIIIYVKYVFTIIFSLLFIIQSCEEIREYFKGQIFTTSTIMSLTEGPLTLTFCGLPPILQKNITVEELEKLLVWPNSKKIKLKKILTLYRGACLSVQGDFQKIIEDRYLFYDWGKK